MAQRSASFNIHTDGQDVIESNARDKFGPDYGDPTDRAQAMQGGFVDADGEITPHGWDILNADIAQLEENALKWLRKNFESARDDGHDRYDDRVGEVWYDTTKRKQLELIEVGKRERVDMSDSSYGDLAYDVWDGISDFGASVLGGAINFDNVDMDEIEQLLSRKVAFYRHGQIVRPRRRWPRWTRGSRG